MKGLELSDEEIAGWSFELPTFNSTPLQALLMKPALVILRPEFFRAWQVGSQLKLNKFLERNSPDVEPHSGHSLDVFRSPVGKMDCHPGGDLYFLGFTARISSCAVGDSKLKRNLPTIV